ncbi:Uncharacterised protein [Chryseobacterium nakagawai]|uniref:Uncharacterized protein n=1 Tax=Chryseobacterium nakagawai TaxID=1241982 RepID=A0AAD0YQ10_CHRNA|nr:hypothetical protein [Chryseobacterium nakagawai]AZA92969.1 hypothetical protein EG343_21395 [Chryseobacterium nakagawai]VEH19593.1 Uncharacterised protein [Chryseobacterium nakagawai]
MKCWICQNNEANSEEHKFKASDIRRQFGKSFDAIYYDGENSHPFNSPKDKLIKFPKVICIDCNNNQTRNADIAYTKFFESTDLINNMIETTNQINYQEIFGNDWKMSKMNLYRYFAKHAGCKIMTSNLLGYVDISQLRLFILGQERISNFYIKIYFNKVTKDFTDYLKRDQKNKYRSNIAFGSTIYVGQGNDTGFAGSIINGSIHIEWFYANQNHFNKTIDFNTHSDTVEILNTDDFYPKDFKDFHNEDFFSYLNFGKYHLNEETLKKDYQAVFRSLQIG